MTQMLGQLGGGAGATPASGAASQGEGAAGGGLMDMVQRMAQSPALHQMAEQVMSGAQGQGEDTPNLGGIMQQMMPMVAQVRVPCHLIHLQRQWHVTGRGT